MSCAAEWDIEICKAKTFFEVFRWETGPTIYKAITAVPQLVPVRLTVTSHGFTDGWRLAITGVNGMKELNAEGDPPKVSDYRRATVIDANTLEFNDINAEDFKPYTGGGYVQGYTPVDLAGYTAEWIVKDKIGGTELADWTANVTIDNAAKTITLELSATTTAALTFAKGVHELKMVSPGGFITSLLMGNVVVKTEVIEIV